MTLPVDLQAVIEALDLAGDEMHSYINRKTGELFWFSEHDWSLTDLEDQGADVPDWAAKTLAKAREVMETDDFIELPGSFEIDEYSIMERFSYEHGDARIRGVLLTAIKGRGAFRHFRDTIHREGVQQEWYAYRDAALREIAVDFLESEGIAYRTHDDPPI